VTARDLRGALELLKHTQYDLVGVSFHSFSVAKARMIREKVKGHLICGGHHPSALPDQMLSIGYNQVIIGEGENAILSILNGNNSPIVKNVSSYFETINDIPFPDYTGLLFDASAFSFGINIISSRGCPFRCAFCASSHFWGKYQMRSAENVLAEVRQRIAEGYKNWIFEDDNFTANRQRALDICAGLDGRLTWQTQGRAESLDEDLCREMYRAGCRRMYLGIESFSQGTLDRCNKKTTVAKMIRGINVAEKAGIRTMCMFLAGFPGDTIKDIEESARVRRSIKISEFGVNNVWILPGTAVYYKAKELGFSDDVYLEASNKNQFGCGVPYYAYEQSLETLKQWQKLM
jgi:radical SAM superfamily enzyme YgiQ (UPF0313 family)